MDIVTQVYKKILEKKVKELVVLIRLLELDKHSMNAYHAGIDLDQLAEEGWVIKLAESKARNMESINFYKELLKGYQRGLDQAGEVSLVSKVATIVRVCLESMNIEVE